MSEPPSRTVLVEDNEPLVGLLRAKREELLASAKLLREKGEVKSADGKKKYVSTIDKAWYSLCDHRIAITTPQEAKKLKYDFLNSNPLLFMKRFRDFVTFCNLFDAEKC